MHLSLLCFENVLKHVESYYGKLSVRDYLRKACEGARCEAQQAALQDWDGVLVSNKKIVLIASKRCPSSEEVTKSLCKEDVFATLLKEGKISYCTDYVPGDAEEKPRLPCAENSSCKC